MRRTFRFSGRDGIHLLLPSPFSKVFFEESKEDTSQHGDGGATSTQTGWPNLNESPNPTIRSPMPSS